TGPLNPEKPRLRPRSAATIGSASLVAARPIPPGGGRERPAAARRRCPRATAPSGLRRGTQGGRAADRAARLATTRTPQLTRPTPHAGLKGSWQQVSDLGVRPVCPAEPADYFDPNQGAWGKLGDSGCPGHPIINHKHPVCPLVNDQWGHPGGRRPEPGNLPLELDRIGTAGPGRRDAQFAGIDIAEIRHLANVSREADV